VTGRNSGEGTRTTTAADPLTVPTNGQGKLTRRRRNPKTSELLARELADEIINRQLPAGARLLTEREMVELYGVGRTTLREALRLLETRGVLTIRAGPHGGPVVRRPEPSDLSEALTLILQFENASLLDVLQARRALEPMVAKLAASRIDASQIEQLEQTIEGMLGAPEDQDVFAAENERFHSLIATAAGSVVLRVFSETLKSIADGRTAGVDYASDRRLAVSRAHKRVLDALRTHDPEAAETEMREHLEEAGRYWGRHYPELVSQPVRWVHS